MGYEPRAGRVSPVVGLLPLASEPAWLQNKYTTCKGIKNNTNLEQITGIKEKLDTTCK
jgi:hypothetical protein